MDSFSLLLFSTVSIAIVHSFAPDHWLPFVMIGKAQNWSKQKMFLYVSVAAIGHVGSSIALGSIGISLGFASEILQGFESTRGQIGLYLLIGFGIAYALWGLKHAHHHHHHAFDFDNKKIVTLWTLFAIFVLGPCEPLIPLMFLGSSFGWSGIALISLLFGGITLLMMLLQSFLGYAGMQLINHRFAEKYSHTFAGLVITLTGVFLLFV
ncbi:MAG: hypothetical protein AAB071_07930 [Bacteroidota bacterium]